LTVDRVHLIRDRLTAAFEPVDLEVIDESHLHVGHEGARDGKGHFRIRIVADRFAGLRPLAAHRLIYDALDDLMKTDIHALSIQAGMPAP